MLHDAGAGARMSRRKAHWCPAVARLAVPGHCMQISGQSSALDTIIYNERERDTIDNKSLPDTAKSGEHMKRDRLRIAKG
jgi:hypothetical protein